ncbi:Trp biosynthesis-associated membrane protein [Terrabacter sp. BE26]|uniref:Trp biosynthesis-associated membrane protein n=1 Tax=Terrabacter sp. BE26 TaxID=2898152 RepID=UPI0035BE47A8
MTAPTEAPARRRALDKKRAALVVLVPAALLLGLTTRPWASGASGDVLAHAVTEVSGSAAAPGVVGLLAVCVVALLGLMTGGRVIRAVAAAVMVLASFAALVMTLLVAVRPVTTVADAVARELARTTAPAATGATTLWAWLAVVAAALLAAGSVLSALSSRSWAGLSSRYERGDKPASGPRGEVRTAWDELSEGRDPTLDKHSDDT